MTVRILCLHIMATCNYTCRHIDIYMKGIEIGLQFARLINLIQNSKRDGTTMDTVDKNHFHEYAHFL